MELMDTIAGPAIPSPAAHPKLWGLRDRHTPPSHNPPLQSEEQERDSESVRGPGSLSSVYAPQGAKAQSARPGIKRGKR